MKMRKILASVVAAAVATSAMAISAFAAVVKDINEDETVYNATVTANVDGTLTAAGTDLEFTVATTAGDTINKVTVELKIITDGDKVTTSTKSADGDTVAFSPNGFAGFDDITKVVDGAAFQATVTALVSKTTAAYVAADTNTNYKVAVANSEGGGDDGTEPMELQAAKLLLTTTLRSWHSSNYTLTKPHSQLLKELKSRLLKK